MWRVLQKGKVLAERAVDAKRNIYPANKRKVDKCGGKGETKWHAPQVQYLWLHFYFWR